MLSINGLSRRLAGGCALCLLCGLAQAATLSLEPFVSAEYRYQSNVFRLSDQDAEILGVTSRSDEVQRYAFGAEAAYSGESRGLRARFEGMRFRYDQFGHLDHSAHRFDASADSELPGPFSGEIGYLDERRLAAFDGRRSTERNLERDRQGRAELRLAVSPKWAIFAGTLQGSLRSPIPAAPGRPPSSSPDQTALPLLPLLPGQSVQPLDPGVPARPASPDFEARERTFGLGLSYGEAPPGAGEIPILSVRLGLEHQRVRFSNLNRPAGEPTPEEDGYELLVLATETVYAVSGLSTLEAEIGATRYRNRDGDGDNPTDLTGDITYRRELTGLTEIFVGIFRRIELFSATADTTTDSGYRAGVSWAPRPALILSASHERVTSEFDGVSGVSPGNRGREDRVRTTDLSIGYTLWSASEVSLFGRFSERVSTTGGESYDDDQYGVRVTLRWP